MPLLEACRVVEFVPDFLPWTVFTRGIEQFPVFRNVSSLELPRHYPQRPHQDLPEVPNQNLGRSH
jgi:hypothetical protein